MGILALISPLVIGAAIIVILLPENSLRGIWLILTVFLGAGIGLGITSSTTFVWLGMIGSPNMGYLTAELSLALILSLLAFYRCQQSRYGKSKDPSLNGRENCAGIQWLKCIFVILLVVSAASFVIKALFNNPHGTFDSWTIWNYRARWMFKGGDQWLYVFARVSMGDKPDYPLLLTGSIFRMWKILEKDYVAVPIILATMFTFGSILMLFFSIAELRGKNQGYLAVMFMFISTQFFNVGSYQYADVPLAFFILSTLILMSLQDNCPKLSVRIAFLTGLTASCAAWTKNEGLLFLVLVGLIRFIGQLGKTDGSKLMKEFFSFLSGLALVVGTLIHFKLNFAPANDLVNQDNLEKLGTYLFDTDRYLLVLTAILKKIFTFNEGIIWLMIVYLLISGFDRSRFPDKRILSYLILMFLMLCGYFFSYLISPHDVEWHIGSSIRRLVIQLWPSWVFLFFYCVKGPEKSPATARDR